MAFAGTQYTELKANALPGRLHGDFSGKAEAVVSVAYTCSNQVNAILLVSEQVAAILTVSEQVSLCQD